MTGARPPRFPNGPRAGFAFCHPDTEEGQAGQWMPMVRTPKHWRGVPNAPIVLALWRIVLNLGLFEERSVEYLNGDRFDLRAANLRVFTQPPAKRPHRSTPELVDDRGPRYDTAQLWTMDNFVLDASNKWLCDRS